MEKEYELQGMSCGGCVSNVKRALLQVPDVTEADVRLNPQGATITMNKSIAVDDLQSQLKRQETTSLQKQPKWKGQKKLAMQLHAAINKTNKAKILFHN